MGVCNYPLNGGELLITNKRVITCDCCDAEDNYPSGSIWFLALALMVLQQLLA